MEILAPGDDVVSPSGHKKRKRLGTGHMPETHQEELHQKRKKMKKRRRTEGMETNEQQEEEDDGGSCQELASEEAGQPATQETTERKKKKKKKKIMQEPEEEEEMVAIEDEEEGEADDCEVSVVVETSITKKKKKHKRRAKEREAATAATGGGGDDDDDDSVAVVDAADHDATEAALAHEGLKREQAEDEDDVPLHEDRRTRRRRRKVITDDDGELWSGVDSALLSELMTYIPDAESRAYDIVNKLLHQDLPRFREFKKNGIQLRWGRFLRQENMTLQQNARNFLALTGIATTNQLFYPERYPDQTKEIRRLRVLHSFLLKMAEDIPRPCFKVYVRGKKMFDDSNYLGRFTEEENHKLQKLQRLHGNNWKIIAQGMGRSFSSIQKRFDMIAPGSGTWSQDEEDLLIRATRLQLEKLARANDAESSPQQLWVTKRQLHHLLPWKAISEMVVQRSWVQCREKWFGLLKVKLAAISNTDEHGTTESILNKITLINTLYVMELEDPAEIDWEQVADQLGNVTPRTAQHIFHRLKLTSVPHAPAISFCELIEFLHDKVVPMLRARAECFSQQTQQEVVKDRYLLLDIFDR